MTHHSLQAAHLSVIRSNTPVKHHSSQHPLPTKVRLSILRSEANHLALEFESRLDRTDQRAFIELMKVVEEERAITQAALGSVRAAIAGLQEGFEFGRSRGCSA